MPGEVDPHRRSIRIAGNDYSQPGAYFITICAQDRSCLFGEVLDGNMRLNEQGQIVAEEWIKTPLIRPRILVDAFVIMPNHFDGIIIIGDGGGTLQRSPTITQMRMLLPWLPCRPGSTSQHRLW
jgi:REP element-mobilizing transposase RayT